jgi:Cadherin domain
MWLSSILNSLIPGPSHTRTRRRPLSRQRPTGHRLTLEALEDRLVLSYTFTPIADTSPDSLYSGLDRPAINDLGATAFTANLRSGGAGIFTRNADGSQGPIIAVTNDLIRTFTLSTFMNDSGTVSFGAALWDGKTAIFTGRGQELTRIADTEPGSPYSSLPAPAARVQNDGTVTFHGILRSGAMGLFVSNGGLPSTLYVTGGQFSAFLGGPASQVNGHTLAFRATLPDGTGGEFTGDGGPATTIATTGPVFKSFIGGEINDAGTLAISANLTAGGQVIVVAQDGMLTPFVGTTGAYSQFFAGQVSINNDGQIVFGADLATGGHGIFQGPDSIADKIITTGDELFGSTVVGFPANGLGVRSLNNAGQIAFSAFLADGRTVLVRADPPVAPTDITLSPSSVAENQPAGTTVGTFSTTDPDTGDTFTYVLVGGAGDTDNTSFAISGGTLQTAASFDFETKSSYSIRVRSTDAGALSVDKVFTISVTNVNEAPTITVPGAQTADEDVDKAISGLSVGDVDSPSLAVTLAVGHGTLTLGTTAGLTITANGTGSVSLSGSIADLNAALAGLIYRGALNYSGADTLSITASDGSLSSSDSVAIAVKSAAQQAADLQAQVNALLNAGVLNKGQANSLNVKLDLKGNDGDIGKVQSFLNEVAADLNAGILTQAQADALTAADNILLISVRRL